MSTVTDLESYQQFALQQQAQNNEWSAQQAQKQMDFQREMSNTAHQREVADLKAAGLNPVLSVNSGASVPNGAAGDTDTSAAGNVGGILQQVLQAQSAREVAGMYNAATIAAAQLSANASMYGVDENNETKREYPDSMWGIISRAVHEAQQGVSNMYNGNNNNKSSNPVVNSARDVLGRFLPNAPIGTMLKSGMSLGSYLKQLNSRQQSAFRSFLDRNKGIKLMLEKSGVTPALVMLVNKMMKWGK